jgi:ubiquinone biosynthesis protein
MEHGVVGVIGFVVVIVLLAAAGSRLLGVRLSLRRALLTGFPGLVAGFVAGYLVNRRHPGQITPLVVIASVVATMLLTVLAELLARPGGRIRAGGLPRPFRALRTMAQSTRRYGQLAQIAARHGLGGFLSGRPAEPGAPGQFARRLRLALEQAGPIFVKLGQVASTRTDLLPAPVTSELAGLQDHVAPAPWPLVQGVAEEELGTSVSEVFEHVDPPAAGQCLPRAGACGAPPRRPFCHPEGAAARDR